jgi:hypothetical protein
VIYLFSRLRQIHFLGFRQRSLQKLFRNIAS